MTSPIAGDREAFEAWRRSTTKMDPDGAVAVEGFGDDAPYSNKITRVMHIAWKAAWQARAALLEPVGEGWQPISTAPKDGRTIELGFMEDGEVTQTAEMQWSHIQRNGLFPGAVGMWVCPGGNFTWKPEPKEFGPTHWRPIAASPKTNGGMGS